jgi:prefoldin subunit 5
MKKGLLSILAGALLVVGCQNYDDQFDSLEQQINALAAQASAITQVQSDLSALATQVSGLAGQLSAADLASVTSQVDAIKTQIDGLASVGEEVDNLNEEVDEILEALGELLEANAVINQNINITNEAELEYVESLIGTEEDDPTVIINGSFRVDNGTLSTDVLAARVDAVVAKVRTVIGAVTMTASATIDASTLGFIDGQATISHGVDISKLATVSKELSLGHYGDIDLSVLVKCSTLTLSNAASITTLNIGNLSGTLLTKEYAIATAVSLGDIALTTSFNAPKAGTFTWGTDAAQTVSLTITVSPTAVVKIQSLPSTTATITLNNSGTGSEGHFDALKTIGPNVTFTNPAKAINLDVLATSSGTLNIDGVAAASLPALVNQGGPISAAAAGTFSAPLLIDANSITTSTTASIEVKSVNDYDNYTVSGTFQTLIAKAQAKSIDLGFFPALKSATITMAGTKSTAYAVTVTQSSTVLEDLTVDGTTNTLSVSGANKLTSLTTAGEITDFTVADTSTITTIAFGHTFISGDTAATVTVSNVTAITSLDMSSLTKVKTVRLTGNTKLASVTPPSSTVLAEPVAPISVVLYSNALTGEYTKAVAGSETTPYAQAAIKSTELAGFKTFIEAYAAQTDRTASGSASATSGYPTITYNMHVDVVTITGGTTTDTLVDALSAAVDAAVNQGLDAADNTADDASDNSEGVTTKNELDLVTAP